jgi:hypothetical protein
MTSTPSLGPEFSLVGLTEPAFAQRLADERQALHEDATRGISFTREQVEAWAGRKLTGDQMQDLEDALPNSSFPECISTIVAHMDLDDETCSAEGCEESLDDNEGYDGLCGTHADQAEKAGKWS